MLFALIFVHNSFAFTLNNNIDAGFSDNKITIRVTANSTCNNAGVSKEELLEIAEDAANKFWNRVPTSNLHLSKGSFYATSDDKFLTGILCITDSVTSCDSSAAVPPVNDIVIACNSNTSDNFTSSGIYAITLPNNIANKKIKGSVILINDTADTPFSALSREEMVNVIAHELGHAVGIGHSQKSQSLMSSDFYPSRDRLGQDDIDAVTYLYPNKLDGCTGLFATIALSNSSNDQGNPSGNISFVFTLLIGLSIGLLMIFLVKNFTNLLFFRRQRQLKFL